MRTNINGVLMHDSFGTIIAIKAAIVRMRRRRAITAERARDAYLDLLEVDYDDLECHLSYAIQNRDLFGDDYTAVIRGRVLARQIGRPVLFREALEQFVRETRARNGALYGERVPSYAPQGLAAHLQKHGA